MFIPFTSSFKITLPGKLPIIIIIIIIIIILMIKLQD